MAKTGDSLLSRKMLFTSSIGIVLTLLLLLLGLLQGVNEAERLFDKDALNYGRAMEGHMVEGERMGQSLGLRFTSAHQLLSAQEFSSFVSPLMEQARHVVAVAYLPRISNEGWEGASLALSDRDGSSLLFGWNPDYLLYRKEGGRAHDFPLLDNTTLTAGASLALASHGVVHQFPELLGSEGLGLEIYAARAPVTGKVIGLVVMFDHLDGLISHVLPPSGMSVTLALAGRPLSFWLSDAASSIPGWQLQHDYAFVVGEQSYQLTMSRPVSWSDLDYGLGALGGLLGGGLAWLLLHLRRAEWRNVRLLAERNQVIEQQVEQQTRELARYSHELEQQKFALDQHSIVSIANATGVITYVNDRFCTVSGYSREELMGRNHRIIKSAAHPAEFYQQMWQTISAGQVWHGVVCNRSKGGELYWVNSTIVPFLDSSGHPYQYVSIRTDITAIIVAEQALAQGQKELGLILDTVPAYIWYKDRDSNIMRANRAAAALAGVIPEQMVGRSHREFFPAEAVERYRADDLRVLASGEPLIGLHEMLARDEGVLHLRVDRVPYRNDVGEVVGLIVMATDITVQTETEQALLQNEERLRRSQAFANIGTWDWNIQSGELHWSERIAPLFGYAVGDLETTYENFINAVHPDDRQMVLDAVGACVAHGAEYNIEHRVVWPDGTVRWLSEKGDVVRAEDGTPLHMLGVVQDIHMRKMAEAALQESEKRLKEAQRLGKIGNWSLDLASGDLYWSEQIYRIFGHEPGAFAASYERFFSMVHPDDVARVKASELRAEQSGIHSVDHRILLPDGSVRWVHEEAHTERDDQGRVVRLQGTVQDITESKALQLQLDKQKQLLDMLHQSITSFVVKADFHETMDDMLNTLLELTGSEYGFTGEVLFGDDGAPYLKTHAITNIAWSPETQALYAQFAAKGFEFRNLNTLFGHVMTSGKSVVSNDPANDPRAGGLPVGHPTMHAFLGVPIYYGDDLVGMYGIANRKEGYDESLQEFLRPFDTTYGVIIHSKRMMELDSHNRQALVEAKEEAELANKAKSEFLSSMSHELRTPMNAILGFAQLLESEEGLSEEQQENIQDIIKGGNHLLELINEVLDLSKIEAGHLELTIEAVPLRDIVGACQKLIRPVAEKYGIELFYGERCLSTLAMYCDYTRTKQVLLNLLSNAIKYNRPAGKVYLECDVRGDMVYITVRDTGPGIAPEKIDGLFAAFNRLGVDSSVEGTGIGLVITKQLVELMGGRIGVDSEMGVGTTFWVELPLLATSMVEGGTRQLKTERAQTSALPILEQEWTLLYIEDNPVNLKLVTQLIAKRTRIRLLTAEEPVHGLELAVAEQPDLILLDINLPEMDGFEVMRHLQASELTRHIPVVALSANAMADDLKRGKEAGFSSYLTKPINVKQFFSVLEEQLASRDKTQDDA